MYVSFCEQCVVTIVTSIHVNSHVDERYSKAVTYVLLLTTPDIFSVFK